MPPHGEFLDDHAIASIATYINKAFNKENSLVSSAEVTKLRNVSTGNVSSMDRAKAGH
jgi:hypothetical protein